jgi:hypothetical protein
MKKMKFKLLLLSFLTILSGCNKSDSNINPNAQNVDYEFTITINGLSHKIKGNTVNGIPSIDEHNTCASSLQGIFLAIKDVSSSNYKSGKVLGCTILIPSMVAWGVNNALLNFDTSPGGYFSNLTDSLGANYNYFFSTTKGGTIGNGGYNIPITITDVGNAPTTYTYPSFGYNHTKTCKGNFNGILYMQNKKTAVYDVPINISIDFKAVRIN